MRVRALLPVALLISAACSSDPTGGNTPPPPPPPQQDTWFLRLEVSSVVVREMCDGFPVDIDGGEWSYKMEVRFPGEIATVVGQTTNFPSAASIRQAGRGASLPLVQNQRIHERQGPSEAGDQITLTIRATEWDYDILGNNPFPDSRMNNRSATKTIGFADGIWPEQPAGTLTLQNTGSCIVDVNYSFQAVKQ